MTCISIMACMGSSCFTLQEAHGKPTRRRVDGLLRAPGKQGKGVLMPSAEYKFLHKHLPRVQWAWRTCMTGPWTFKS